MFVKAIVIAIIAASLYKLLQLTLDLGLFSHYFKHYPGKCSIVPGADFGAEDIQVTSSGLAFITSGVTYSAMASAFKDFRRVNNVKGKILLYDFKKPENGASELKIKASPDFNIQTFNAHGMSLLEDKVKGEHLIYVINHPEPEVDRIEKFQFQPKTKQLLHVKSFFSDRLHITNDLAVVEEDRFYISDYLFFDSHALSVLEQALKLPVGAVLYFNGTDMVDMDSGLRSPNGVTLSNDKKFLYVSLPLLKQVKVYARKADNSLSPIQDVDVFTALDNFHLSSDGKALYGGCHPIGLGILKHLMDPNNKTPSQVLRLPLKDGKVVAEEITELFYDHGDLISGSTIAAIYNNKMLVGSIIDKLVLCDVSVPL